MVDLLPFILILILFLLGVFSSTVKRITEGNEAIVERFGRYHRTLKPGLNFGIIPIIDMIVVEADTREVIFRIDPKDVIVKDGVKLQIDVVIFWRIMELQSAYYAVQDVEEALENIVVSTLRSEASQMELDQIFFARESINRGLLEKLDSQIQLWGIKVTRVEAQGISLSEKLIESLEKEKLDENNRRAAILEAETEDRVNTIRIGSTVNAIRYLSSEIQASPYAKEILQFLATKEYIQANLSLSQSSNAKVVFMDPKAMSHLPNSLSELLNSDFSNDGSNISNNTDENSIIDHPEESY